MKLVKDIINLLVIFEVVSFNRQVLVVRYTITLADPHLPRFRKHVFDYFDVISHFSKLLI